MFTTSFRRRMLLRLVMIADECVFTISLLTAFWANSYGSASGKFALSKILHLQIQVIHFILLSVVMLTWHLLFRVNCLYQSRRLDKGSQELRGILKATTWGTVTCFTLGHVFKINVFTPVTILVFWLSSTVLTFLFRKALRKFLDKVRQHGRNLRFILIVGTNRKTYQFVRTIEEKKEWGYRIVGYIDDKMHLPNKGTTILGAIKDFPSIIKNHVIDEILITLPVRSYYEDIKKLVQLSEEQGIKIRYLSDIFETQKAQLREEEAEDLSVMTMTTISGRQKDWYYFVKRITDVILASFLIIIASPIMLLTALAIKLTSPGHVFFIQTRVGLNKRRFRLYKFRTMVTNAEKLQLEVERLNEMDGPVFKISNDPRITKIGRWLRKTSIDELPQLFNVLKGDMSLVGPRPLPERDYHGFDKDWQRKRFSVLPGITCIWQVSGRNDVTFEEWMRMDLEYIDKCTPFYDLEILLKTIPAVIRKKGAS